MKFKVGQIVYIDFAFKHHILNPKIVTAELVERRKVYRKGEAPIFMWIVKDEEDEELYQYEERDIFLDAKEAEKRIATRRVLYARPEEKK